jgi:hypothetical protein
VRCSKDTTDELVEILVHDVVVRRLARVPQLEPRRVQAPCREQNHPRVIGKPHGSVEPPHVEKTADDWSNGVDHGGMWPAKLERLYRDVRCGGFHPANTALVHEIVGKTALGVLAEEQRW